MPKAIKKRPVKTKKAEEVEVRDVLGKARALTTGRWFRAALGLGLSVLAALGFYLYRVNAGRQASAFEYEGYRLYYGLYEGRPVPETERLEKALESFKKAFQKKPSAFSLYYMANSHFKQGRYDEAESALKKLNERFPDDERFLPLSYYKLSTLYRMKAKPEEAMKYLDALYNYKAVSFKDLALIEWAGLLEETGKKDEAKKKYELFLKSFPGSPYFREVEMRLKELP